MTLEKPSNAVGPSEEQRAFAARVLQHVTVKTVYPLGEDLPGLKVAYKDQDHVAQLVAERDAQAEARVAELEAERRDPLNWASVFLDDETTDEFRRACIEEIGEGWHEERLDRLRAKVRDLEAERDRRTVQLQDELGWADDWPGLLKEVRRKNAERVEALVGLEAAEALAADNRAAQERAAALAAKWSSAYEAGQSRVYAGYDVDATGIQLDVLRDCADELRDALSASDQDSAGPNGAVRTPAVGTGVSRVAPSGGDSGHSCRFCEEPLSHDLEDPQQRPWLACVDCINGMLNDNDRLTAPAEAERGGAAVPETCPGNCPFWAEPPESAADFVARCRAACTCPKSGPGAPTFGSAAIHVGHGPGCPAVELIAQRTGAGRHRE